MDSVIGFMTLQLDDADQEKLFDCALVVVEFDSAYDRMMPNDASAKSMQLLAA